MKQNKYVVQVNHGTGWENNSMEYNKGRAWELMKLYKKQPKYRIKRVPTPHARKRGN